MNKRWQQMNDWFQQQPRDRRILIATLSSTLTRGIHGFNFRHDQHTD